MVEICTHNFLLFKRKEFWFYNKEEIIRAAYNVFCYTLDENPLKKSNLLQEKSSEINLQKSEEDLWRAIHQTTIYEVKKAEKLNITSHVNYSPTRNETKDLIHEFSDFAIRKKIEWNKHRLLALQKVNRLIISEAWLNNQKTCTHVYLHDMQRVLLLHSFHAPTNIDGKIKGYVNKYLHWKDILTFKRQGFSLYDFGGINFEKHSGITRFKLSFGGEVVDRYSYIEVNKIVKVIKKNRR